MKDSTGAKKTCPHCGSQLSKTPSIPLYILIPALITGAVLFLLKSGRADIETPMPGGRLGADAAAYIGSPDADKACGVCLTAADKFLAEKRLAALREKTKDMAAIPAGEYQTGSPDGLGDSDEHPRHQVRLDVFYIEKHEVTTAAYLKFAGETGGNYPEWEAAARGGTASAFSFGDNSARAGDYAWYNANAGEKPNPVGEKKPNNYGLYDMHGNVWEWVSDRYDKAYYAKGANAAPEGPAGGTENVIRGGSWDFDAESLRSANRASTYKANDDIGFRCAVSESALTGG